MIIPRLLAVILPSLLALEIGATGFMEKYPSFMQINNQTVNFPDKDSKLYGITLENVGEEFCLYSCQELQCPVVSFDGLDHCYISTNDPYIMNRGLFYVQGSVTFINYAHFPSFKYYIFMPYMPPWTPPIEPPSVTMDECAQLCNANESDCYSFSYTPINQTCYMYSKSLIIDGANDVQPKVLSPSRMYFEKKVVSLTNFHPVPGFRIKGDSIDVNKRSDCVQACLNSATCKSFSMNINLVKNNIKMNCRLSNSIYDVDYTKNLVKDSSSMYFYMKASLDSISNNVVYPFRPQNAITSVHFPDSYPTTIDDTSATIIAPQGTTMNATLTRINLRMAPGSLTKPLDTLTINGVELKNSDSNTNIPADASNKITVNFNLGRGDAAASNSDFSYRLKYNWDWICNKSPVSLTATKSPQILANPGFPNNAKGIGPCNWKITASDPTSSIYLSFTNFPWRKVLNITGSNGRNITNGRFRSNYFGNSVTIAFDSRLGRRSAFQFYYVETSAQSDVVNVSKTMYMGKNDTMTVFFDRALNLTDDQVEAPIINLRYRIRVRNFTQLNSYSNITFESLGFGRRWFSECYDGYVWVGIIGSMRRTTKWYISCGVSKSTHTIRWPMYFGFIGIRARLYQRSGDQGTPYLNINERSGFRIKIKTGIPVIKEKAVGVQNNQVLKPDRDDEDDFYLPNQDKYWSITSQPKKVPLVRISDINLGEMPMDEICDNDRLIITQELSYPNRSIIREICGDNSLSVQPTLYFPYKDLDLHIKFLADDRHTSTGFNINVFYVNVYAGLTGSGAQEVSEPGYLVSYLYPRLMTGTTTSWNITSKTYSHCRVRFEFATFDELCKLIRLYFPGGGVISQCVHPYDDPLEFPTGTVLTWIVPHNSVNRLAANVSFYQKTVNPPPPSVNVDSEGEDFTRIANQKLNIPDKASGSRGKMITNVERSVCLAWCLSSDCRAVSYNNNQQTCYLSTWFDLNVMSKGLITDTETTTFLTKRDYPNLKYFVFLAVIPPFPVKNFQPAVSIEECAYYCNWINNNCQSFLFAPLAGGCHIYSQSYLGSTRPYDSKIKPKLSNPSSVYFEKQSGSLYYFNHFSGYATSRNVTQNYAGTAEQCAKLCLSSTVCKSFSFGFGGPSNCNLSTSHFNSTSDFGLLIRSSYSVYFYMKTTRNQDVLRRQGELTGPLFPNSFPSGSMNILAVTAPQGTSFSATITRLNLRRSQVSDGSGGARKCLDTLTINGQPFCDQAPPYHLGPFNTSGANLEPQLTVELNSKANVVPFKDSKSYNYRIEYTWDWKCQSDPGVTLRASSTPQRLANPGYPNNMTINGACQWTIQAVPDSHVYLSFVKLPYVSGLSVSGSNNNKALKSGDFGNKVTISYQKGRQNVYDTFELYYMLTEGSASKYNVSVYTKNVSLSINPFDVISVPVVTSNISASIIDIWYEVNITSVVPGTYTSISFNKLGIGKVEWFDECYDGFVSIGDSFSLSSKLITLKRFCGTSTRGMSMRLDSIVTKFVIWGRLYRRRIMNSLTYTLSPEQQQGFDIEIIPGVPFFVFPETISIKNTSTFSPDLGADNKYESDQNDLWVVETKNQGAIVTLGSVELATIPNDPTICDNDRLTVTYIGDAYSICGRNTINPKPTLYFAVAGNALYVRFRCDDRLNARGFNASVVYTNIYSMSNQLQTVNAPGYLISDKYPKMLTNTRASWKINSKSFSHFRLKLYFASGGEPCKSLTLNGPGGSQTKCLGNSTNQGFIELQVGTTVTWKSDSKANRFAARVTYFDKQTSTSGLSGGAIAGIVIGILLVIALAAGIAFFFIQSRNQTPGAGIGPIMFNKGSDNTNIVNEEMSESTGTSFA